MDNIITAGFALTGSYCTFSKALAAAESLIAAGIKLIPIFSDNSSKTDTRFGKASDVIEKLEALTGNKAITTIPEAEPIGPKKLVDILIIAPCTGNTIAKLANGIADTTVTLAAKSQLRNNRPVLIAISTNEPVIIVLSRENLVKSRASVLSTNFLLFRASTISFKSQNIIMEGCANHVKNNRSMQ